MEFLSFDTEESYDNVTIHDGDTSSNSTLLGIFSGRRLPGTVFSDSTMLISFQSDGATRAVGFAAKYTILWSNGCGKMQRLLIVTKPGWTLHQTRVDKKAVELLTYIDILQNKFEIKRAKNRIEEAPFL